MLEAPFGTVGALATGFGWITGQAGSIFLILRSSCGKAVISRRWNRTLGRKMDLETYLVQNSGCEDLEVATPGDPQLVKIRPHLRGLCQLLRA